jgi:alpha-beta hydrolase superfamily lysophospholipase
LSVEAAIPLHFGPASRALFGWYHAPSGTARAAVVICPPIGDDYVRAHRSLRHLAEALAARGFAVVRFDFHGTGDSPADERAPDRAGAWLADVVTAADEARRRSGASAVALVGLRLGATLAAAAADAARADSLVLWGPYASGAEWVTESRGLEQMHRTLEPQSFSAEPAGWRSEGGEQALGFLLTPSTVKGLEHIDLRKLTALSAHTLLIGTGPTGKDQTLLQRLRAIGPAPEYRSLPGHRFLMTPPQRSEVPRPIIDAIVTWLDTRHATAASTSEAPQPIASAPVAVGGGVEEQPLVFGDAHQLFGILTLPPPDRSDRRDGKRPAIILANAGCAHRIGPHRLYVRLSRAWAQLGFHVLRMDLSGIGDSPAAPGCAENQSYPRSGVADLQAAMSALSSAIGAQRFILAGLGSGADLSFQAALQDARAAGIVLLNPRTFGVHDGELIEKYKHARHYQDALLRASSWKKALRGRVDLGRALGLFAPKVIDVVRSRVDDLMSPLRGPRADRPTDVPHRLRELADRGVDTLLVAAANDPGIDFLDARFKKEMAALAQLPNFQRADLRGTDHTFTSSFVEEQLTRLLSDHLSSKHFM